jgi:hypothetical protein
MKNKTKTKTQDPALRDFTLEIIKYSTGMVAGYLRDL